jgi:hypothetical protein
MAYDSSGAPGVGPEDTDELTYFVNHIETIFRPPLASFEVRLTHLHFATLKGLTDLMRRFHPERVRFDDCFLPDAQR